eukprot:scaffold655017_cov34-Prasinocladus_malaysianus.AAC.1
MDVLRRETEEPIPNDEMLAIVQQQLKAGNDGFLDEILEGKRMLKEFIAWAAKYIKYHRIPLEAVELALQHGEDEHVAAQKRADCDDNSPSLKRNALPEIRKPRAKRKKTREVDGENDGHVNESRQGKRKQSRQCSSARYCRLWSCSESDAE